MDYRIEHREAFTLTGLPLATTTEGKRGNMEIPAFWKKCGEDGSLEKLCRLIRPGATLGVLGASVDWDPASGRFTYLIAIEEPTGRAGLPPGSVDVKVAAGTWAIFTARGPLPKAFQDMVGRVWGEWFPDSGYEHAAAPQLEIYPEGDAGAADYKSELWIPVKKKPAR